MANASVVWIEQHYPVEMKVDLILVSNRSRLLFLAPIQCTPMVLRSVVHNLDFVVVNFVVIVNKMRFADKTIVQLQRVLGFRFDDRKCTTVVVFPFFDDLAVQTNARAKPYIVSNLDRLAVKLSQLTNDRCLGRQQDCQTHDQLCQRKN